jgi:hypothetical protein
MLILILFSTFFHYVLFYFIKNKKKLKRAPHQDPHEEHWTGGA